MDPITQFLHSHHLENAQRISLAGDASLRRYERIIDQEKSYILMDASSLPDCYAGFIHIQKHLAALGYHVPQIFEKDEENKLVLIEDFKDNSFAELYSKRIPVTNFYPSAIDVLISWHQHPIEQIAPDWLPEFSDNILIKRIELFYKWYLPGILGKSITVVEQKEFCMLWQNLFSYHKQLPTSFTHWDYEQGNLYFLPESQGIKTCGIIDFQDALKGPVVYDLLSLLENCRNPLDVDLIKIMKKYYLQNFPNLSLDVFEIAYATLSAMRMTKILGQFIREPVRSSKNQYLKYLPNTWKVLERHLNHPALQDLKKRFDEYVPQNLRSTQTIHPKAKDLIAEQDFHETTTIKNFE